MHALIVGASSQVAHFLVPQLLAVGHRVIAISRHGPKSSLAPSVKCIRADALQTNFALPAGLHIDVVFHLPPIWAGAVPVTLYQRIGAARIIAFSSTSVFHRAASADAADRAFAHRISAGEQALAQQCRALDMSWTLLRPTMMYGCGLDHNVTTIARFIRRFGFFPLVGEARGCRQPVHAADVADTCLAALANVAARERAYDLSGAEQISFRQLVERVFQALCAKPRLFPIPRKAAMAALDLARCVPRYRSLSRSLVDRMEQDQCQSHAAAAAELGFAPRGFQLDSSAL